MKRYIFLLLFVCVFLAGCEKPAGQIPPASDSKQTQETTKADGYAGGLLAGKSSPYLIFNKADYDKAIVEGKIVFLDFYANWCPICRAEAPEIKAGFDGLNRSDVVGFRVNYNDPDTDDDEKALAAQFSIPYQHTKVILKNGKEVYRSSDQWTADDFSKTLGAY